MMNLFEAAAERSAFTTGRAFSQTLAEIRHPMPEADICLCGATLLLGCCTDPDCDLYRAKD